MAIKLDIEKVIIPIDFGEVELGFNPSEENILRLTKINSDKDSELAKLHDVVKSMENIKDSDVTPEKLEEIMEVAKATSKELFEQFLGAGSFDKVYAVYPSIEVLLSGFVAIMNQIPDEVSAYKERVQKLQANKIAKYKRK